MINIETNGGIAPNVLRKDLWVPGTPTHQERFAKNRIAELTSKYLEDSIYNGKNILSHAGEKKFAVTYIHALDKFSDIPRSVEANVFSESFDEPLEKVVEDYGKYDEESVFATVIDLQPGDGKPIPVAAMRIINYREDLGFKDINDLLSEQSPWINDIRTHYFGRFEKYDPQKAWERLGIAACGQAIDLGSSVDIASHAVIPEYAGKSGKISSASMLFYHACMRYTLVNNIKSYLAIYDLPPLNAFQRLGEPFRTYPNLQPRPYGGPFDTIPAFSIVNELIHKVKNKRPEVIAAFILGTAIDEFALLPGDFDSNYSINDKIIRDTVAELII